MHLVAFLLCDKLRQVVHVDQDTLLVFEKHTEYLYLNSLHLFVVICVWVRIDHLVDTWLPRRWQLLLWLIFNFLVIFSCLLSQTTPYDVLQTDCSVEAWWASFINVIRFLLFHTVFHIALSKDFPLDWIFIWYAQIPSLVLQLLLLLGKVFGITTKELVHFAIWKHGTPFIVVIWVALKWLFANHNFVWNYIYQIEQLFLLLLHCFYGQEKFGLGSYHSIHQVNLNEEKQEDVGIDFVLLEVSFFKIFAL